MTAEEDLPPQGLPVTVGGLSREDVRAALAARGVALNESAAVLLDGDDFARPAPRRTVVLVERTVAALGLPDGAPLSRILGAATAAGLRLCPPQTAVFLRLALPEQTASPDAVLRAGRAPAGSLTVASLRALADDDGPKGFSLRVVAGSPWLRGFHCTDEHVWSPGDRFVFRLPQR